MSWLVRYPQVRSTPSSSREGVGGPQDPAVLFAPEDVVADIGGDFRIIKAGRVLRPVSTAPGERSAVDSLVVATRA